ncbi:ThuA domain-containing protein [Pleomorphovibrio marinus]|uniref:ThuA domain-containing protein n=1 Tax=Pleomorphovibrio marinus TaxID=2164132 RepID=UPI0013002EC3|nr:ThuA domain-containing protein [Pleomorphovibrio marinus]
MSRRIKIFKEQLDWAGNLKRLLIVLMFLIYSLAASAQNGDKIPVLIVDGFSNHDWEQTTEVTKWILEESGMFKVEVSTVPTDSLERLSWLPEFNNYPVIIQNTNNINNLSLKWPREAEIALENYVADGGGLYVLHSANNAFSHWKAYDEMIGLGWRSSSAGTALEIGSDESIIVHPPGEGKGTGHGDRFNAVVELYNRHPINYGFPDKWQTVNTEVYYYPRGPAKNIEILSYAYDSTGTQKNWPVEWVVIYGKGRVYNSSLGHLWEGETYPPAYRCVGYQTTVIRVTEWLATRDISYPVPLDFPRKDSPSLRPEEGFVKKE